MLIPESSVTFWHGSSSTNKLKYYIQCLDFENSDNSRRDMSVTHFSWVMVPFAYEGRPLKREDLFKMILSVLPQKSRPEKLLKC